MNDCKTGVDAGRTEKTRKIGTSASGKTLSKRRKLYAKGKVSSSMKACNSKDVSNSSNTVTECTRCVRKQMRRAT